MKTYNDKYWLTDARPGIVPHVHGTKSTHTLAMQSIPTQV